MKVNIVPGKGNTAFWLVVKWEDGVKVKHPAGSEIEARRAYNQFYKPEKQKELCNVKSRETVYPGAV